MVRGKLTDPPFITSSKSHYEFISLCPACSFLPPLLRGVVTQALVCSVCCNAERMKFDERLV